MNSRVVAAASRAILAPRSACINQARNSSHYKPPTNWFPVSYNELPVPQGSWKTAYESEQRKYNIHLAAGIGFFMFTMAVITQSGLVVLNGSIPPLPEDGK